MINTKPCLNCGRPAIVRQNRWARTKYCSPSCGARMRGVAAGIKATQDAANRRGKIRQPKYYRLIPLTKGTVVKVDIEDYADVKHLNWCRSDSGYARRTIKVNGDKKTERLHRLIMERTLGRLLDRREQVDHRNGDRLDNRRANLRLATHNQNSFNVRRKNSFNLVGVAKNHDRFMANITAYRTHIYVGTFDTPEEAAWFRDQWAIAIHGEFAVLNFDYQSMTHRCKHDS